MGLHNPEGTDRRWLAPGIEYIQVKKLYVIRIMRDQASPFVIGPLMAGPVGGHGSSAGRVFMKHDIDQWRDMVLCGATFADRQKLIVSGRTLSVVCVTNGAIFSDDCFTGKYPHRTYTDRAFPVGQMIHDSSALSDMTDYERALPLPNGGKGPPKYGRWIFWTEHHHTGLYNASQVTSNDPDEWGADHLAGKWDEAIGGGGGLIYKVGGTIHMPTNQQWKNKDGSYGFFLEGGQLYCAGPVLAMNHDRSVLYLIQDYTYRNQAYKLARDWVSNRGRTWSDMQSFLRSSSFLTTIGRAADGSVDYAVTYDGGGSRAMWIRGRGAVIRWEGWGRGYNSRPLPAYIGIWGQVKP